MHLRLLIVGWLFAAGAAVHADGRLDDDALKKALDATLNSHPTAQRTTVTLKVIDLESGDVLYDRGGDRLLTPASNLKIYTAACALDTFGSTHRFQTTVGAGCVMRNGNWYGDLWLIGGGDSMLRTKDLATLADRAVKEMHLKSISGRVKVDNSRYGGERLGPGWMWDDEPSDYSMAVTPLMLDFNTLTVKLTPGANGTEAKLAPPADYPSIRRAEKRNEGEQPSVTRRPFGDDLILLEGVELEKPVEQKLSVNDPGRWTAAVFEQMLRDRGVEFLPGMAGMAGTKPSFVISPWVTHDGPPLSETLKHFNHESENAVGEVLLHEIAIEHGVKRPAWPAGAKVISKWLVDKAGLEKGSFRLVDGSGLSRYNLISADSSVRLLKYLHDSAHFDAFFQSLPIEKVDGKPVVSAKGGSMSGVSTMSGYIKTDDGRLLAFSLLANGFLGDNKPVFDLRQCVWRELVRYRP
jgi:PBP4 family serine-type D-alanyl-D-alanine carboxypeptidase